MKEQKGQPIIELKNVWKTYDQGEVPVHALKGIDLRIYEGDFVVILGKSGSGKSTLMNMIGALDTPSKGKIFLSGADIKSFSESSLAQVRGSTIGFVFQQFNLMPILSAVENVALPMFFQGIPSIDRIKRSEELLGLVGLGSRMYHKPTELSGGEQQRVAIARALSNNTAIILADEPTGNLDSNTGEQIMQLLSALHKKDKKTIILVTHDINLVKYAHRTIYLKDGIITSDNHHKPKRGLI
jgi:putative ABC transport system ATP-binding protein